MESPNRRGRAKWGIAVACVIIVALGVSAQVSLSWRSAQDWGLPRTDEALKETEEEPSITSFHSGGSGSSSSASLHVASSAHDSVATSDTGGPIVLPQTEPPDWEGVEKEPPARLAYAILASGMSEVEALERLLPLIYDPGSIYVVHLDKKSSAEARERLRQLLERTAAERGGSAATGSGGPTTTLLSLEPPMSVTWGGLSLLLATMWAIGRALKLSPSWDYIVNLSPAHLPLLTQKEMGLVLRVPRITNSSFLNGERYTGPDFAGGHDRRDSYYEDALLYRHKAHGSVMRPLGEIPGQHMRAVRPRPTRFDVWKGQFWMTMHRTFAEYMDLAPDNGARSLLSYFSSFRIPDESYFQTLACYSNTASRRPVARNVSLHYVTPYRGAHPVAMSPSLAREAAASGNLFARRFVPGSTKSAAAADLVESFLREGEGDEVLSQARMALALDNIRASVPFCSSDRFLARKRSSVPWGLGLGLFGAVDAGLVVPKVDEDDITGRKPVEKNATGAAGAAAAGADGFNATVGDLPLGLGEGDWGEAAASEEGNPDGERGGSAAGERGDSPSSSFREGFGEGAEEEDGGLPTSSLEEAADKGTSGSDDGRGRSSGGEDASGPAVN